MTGLQIETKQTGSFFQLQTIKENTMAALSITINEMALNHNEYVKIFGGYGDDNLSFDYFLYSEAFDAWVKQDLNYMKTYYVSSYQELSDKVERFLIREGI